MSSNFYWDHVSPESPHRFSNGLAEEPQMHEEPRDFQKVLISRPSMASSLRSMGSAVPNFSRVLSKSQQFNSRMDRGDLSLELPAIRTSPCKLQGIKRWNGQTRTFSDWDSLRKV